MLIYTIKRFILALTVALTVSIFTFLLLHLSADPAVTMAGESATAEQIEDIRVEYGFDRPLFIQYWEWLGKALKGDLGKSAYFDTPVTQLLAERIPVTMALGACAMGLGVIVAIPLGVFAAMKPNTFIDRSALLMAVGAQALPNFWFALILIGLFSVKFPILPASGSDSWQNYVMPTIVLGTHAMPAIMRLTRTGMLDVLSSDYIRTARAKGLRVKTVMFKHALRNAMIPVVSVIAVQLGFFLGGSVVTETIFALHGIGYLAYESISRTDLPTMQAIVLLFSLFFTLTTFFADVLNVWLDPRIRVS